MREKPKEKYGKLLKKLKVGDTEYQVRERRSYKSQIQRGRKRLVSGSSLSLCRANKSLIHSGFKTEEEVIKHLIEEVIGIKEYNLKFKGQLS
jgi:hypothetical protein